MTSRSTASDTGTSESGSLTEHYDARGEVVMRIEALTERDLKALLTVLTVVSWWVPVLVKQSFVGNAY